jgi:hypothetical protein
VIVRSAEDRVENQIDIAFDIDLAFGVLALAARHSGGVLQDHLEPQVPPPQA